MIENQNLRILNRSRPKAYAASRQDTVLPITVSPETIALFRKNRPKLTSNFCQPEVKLPGVNCSGNSPMLLAISWGDLKDVPTIQISG